MSDIQEGYNNLMLKYKGTPNEEAEKISEERYKICKTCEHFERTFLYCVNCGCDLEAKTRATKYKCELNKW